MMPSNDRMQKTDLKQRLEAALTTCAVLTSQWSAARAERKRLTHTMFKIRQALERAATAATSRDGDPYPFIVEAIDLTLLTTANIGKKAAKKEGLVIP